MNDPDNFLSRWSRRKREAAEPKEQKSGEANFEPAPGSEKQGSPSPKPHAPATPEFDIESLPPIESIAAETDVAAFMRAGVPDALKHAALRRAWSADPAIRDFMGPTENYWDAAGPDGIPGFGDLDPGVDVQRMVSELFGETPPQDVADEKLAADRTKNTAPSMAERQSEEEQPPSAQTTSAKSDEDEEYVPQRGGDVASQQNSPEPAAAKKIARRHGGAMPQ
jgi:hypothetical protein